MTSTGPQDQYFQKMARDDEQIVYGHQIQRDILCTR